MDQNFKMRYQGQLETDKSNSKLLIILNVAAVFALSK